MKLKESNPRLVELPLKEFFDAVQWGTIFSLFTQIAEYYNSKLSMISVLSYYGIDYVGVGEDQIQVNCLLLEHGSEDFNKSARYYSFDRTTGDDKEGVYCFKCQKYLTAFWYLYKMEREYKKIGLIDFFVLIKRVFRVDFPKNLVLDFDPDSYYTFEDSGERQNILSLFSYAKTLRNFKLSDPKLYLNSIVNLYKIMKIGA